MEKPLRIAHIVATTGRGGIETWLFNLLPLLPHDRFACEIVWINRESEGPLAQGFRQVGIPVWHCPNAFGLFKQKESLLNHLQKMPYDIVHLHFAEGGIKQHLAVFFSISRKRIMHLHNTKVSPYNDILTRTIFRMFRLVVKNFPHLTIGNSHGTLREYFGDNWKTYKRARLLYLGVSEARFHLSEKHRQRLRKKNGWAMDDIVIGHVGSYGTIQKNQEAVINTVAELRQRGVRAYGLLIGDGPRLSNMKLLASTLGIAQQCHFLGEQPKVENFYPAMDVLLFPSCWEGFGLVSLEAQACGVPVVASDIPGLRETILFPECCRLTSDDHPATLADACLSLAGKRTPGILPLEHRIEESARRLAEIYEELILKK